MVNWLRKGITLVLGVIMAGIVCCAAGCDSSSEQPSETVYKEYENVAYGLDITQKKDIISICYSAWFTQILGNDRNPPNVTEILAGNGSWGHDTQFHYWGKPAAGYYMSHNKKVIRNPMSQLGSAGVDFIIVDYTYLRNTTVGTENWRLYVTAPMEAILETILEMRGEGLQTPYVVFWGYVNDTTQWTVVNELYRQFYEKEQYRDCFVYWEGKPFMLVNRLVDNPPETCTFRAMWGLRQSLATSEWSFLNVKNVPSLGQDGQVEQTCVSPAAQETYMTEPTAHGRNHGIFFYTQWMRAFEYRPKVITLTWWNEWVAQLFRDSDGNPRFTDNYNMEFSRDIEPVEGGHGDQYYRWMCEYIRAYKAGEACPMLVESGYESEAERIWAKEQ